MSFDKTDGPPAMRRTINGWRNATKRATKRRLAAEKTPMISARIGGMGGFPSPAPIINRFAEPLWRYAAVLRGRGFGKSIDSSEFIFPSASSITHMCEL